ncbi:MAG: hypothetical protein DHS20C19_01590 [Acidimicrobiales bacterium]|nr:MAG: hypothetical protein DHS20C19_01590 [Acidimicrobiales bacterium]
MTMFDFVIESKEYDVRIAVPVSGIFEAVAQFRRLDTLAANGRGRVVEELPGHGHVDDLTIDDVRALVAPPADEDTQAPDPTRQAREQVESLSRTLPDDATFEAWYFET